MLASTVSLSAHGQEIATGQAAAQAVRKEALVTLEDLGIENPGLLQTNPFYFMKSLRRSTKRSLSFGPLKKAEAELRIANELAAELKRFQEVVPENEAAFRHYLEAYKEQMGAIESLFAGLDWSNAEVKALAGQALSQAVLHNRVSVSLMASDNLALNEKIEMAVDRLVRGIAAALERDPSLVGRFAGLADAQRPRALGEFWVMELAERVLANVQDPALRASIVSMESDLALETVAAWETADRAESAKDAFPLLPVNSARLVSLIDLLRSRADDAALKNALSFARQRTLEAAGPQHAIGKKDAERMIIQASTTLDVIMVSAGSMPKQSFLTALFNKAAFNLNQARESFDGGLYEASFGQASLAYADASYVLAYGSLVSAGRPRIEKALAELKAAYDGLSSADAVKKLPKSYAPYFTQAAKLEKALARLADALEDKKTSDDRRAALIIEAYMQLARVRMAAALK